MNYHKRVLVVIFIAFATFNLLVFVIPFQRNAVFWIAYVFAVIAILSQALIYKVAFDKADNLPRVFLGYPIFKIGKIYLTVQVILSIALMITASFVTFPVSVAIVPSAVLLAGFAIAIILSDIARDKIDKIRTGQIVSTQFISELRAGLQSLIPRVTDNALKTKLEKLSEAVRFSDPVSSKGLEELENEMKQKFILLKQAVLDNTADGNLLADEFLFLVNERNQKCRVLKQQN